MGSSQLDHIIRKSNRMRYNTGSSVIRDESVDDKDLTAPEREKLGTLYFRAVRWTSLTVLEVLVAMVFLTWQAQGFASPLAYCKNHLKWKQSIIRRIFTPPERTRLTSNPAEKPYDPQLNIKLLTEVWTFLGKKVAMGVRNLENIMKSSIHDPPNIPSKHHLRGRLFDLFSRQEQLTDTVRERCHEVLKDYLKPQRMEMFVLNQCLRTIYWDMQSADRDLHFAPIMCAVATMKLSYFQACADEDFVPREGRVFSMREYQKMMCTTEQDLKKLAAKLEKFQKANTHLSDGINKAELCYMMIIKMSRLWDVMLQLNYIAEANVSRDEISAWYQELQELRRDKKTRFETLGACEVLAYTAGLTFSLRNTSRWLMTKTYATLHVSKIYSHLREFTTGEVTSLEEFLRVQMPQVITIYGPLGSGRSCLCQYLYNEWRKESPSITWIGKCQLTVLLTAESVQSKSFVPHLKNTIFKRSLYDVEDSEVLNTIGQMKVLFLVDASSGASPGFVDALKEILNGANKHHVLITSHLDKRRELKQVFRNMKVEPKEATFEPLNNSQLQELCLDYLKLRNPSVNSTAIKLLQSESLARKFHHLQLPDDSNTTVKCFINKLKSEEREDELLYPLPLAYLLMLWLEEPGSLNKISTVSQLFERVILFCQAKVAAKIKDLSTLSKCITLKTAKEKMQDVYDMALKMFKSKESHRMHVNGNVEPSNSICDVCSDSLFPLLVCSGNVNSRQKHGHRFLHSAITDILLAWSTVLKVNNRKVLKFFVFSGDLAKTLPVSLVQRSGHKYTDMIRYTCGFLSCKQCLRPSSAAHIIDMFRKAGVSEKDFLTWRSLLCEGSWSPVLARLVAEVLDINYIWKVPDESYQECRAVSQLVSHGAYHPQEVLISTHPSKEVISMLASRSCINVRILPAQGFHGVREAVQQDALLCAIQEAGNVIELWGKLEEKGAAALASMTRLHTLYVYLSSLAAVQVFCKSMRSCSALHYLHIYLDLPLSISVNTVPPLLCPASTKVCLELAGIRDDSWKWAADVSKQLGCRYEELILTCSNLSPGKLHQLKLELHPTPVHTSR